MTTSTVTPPAGTVPADLRRGALSARRRVTDVTSRVLMWAAIVVAIIPLGAVVYYVVVKGSELMSWDFVFSGRIPRQVTEAGGSMWPAVVGTIVTTGLASLIAIPLGVLGAIYLNEFGKQSLLARTIRTMADVMSGVPSIVMGLFIFLIFVTPYGHRTGLAGALALACLMLPVVVRSSEEMLRLVPNELREASLALGSRKWRTTLTVVLPAAISGITSGSLLAIARAAGETAPILLVTGVVYRAEWNPLKQNTSLPAQIFNNANLPYETAQARGWGAALTLVIIVLVTTLVARVIANRYAIKER